MGVCVEGSKTVKKKSLKGNEEKKVLRSASTLKKINKYESELEEYCARETAMIVCVEMRLNVSL